MLFCWLTFFIAYGYWCASAQKNRRLYMNLRDFFSFCNLPTRRTLYYTLLFYSIIIICIRTCYLLQVYIRILSFISYIKYIVYGHKTYSYSLRMILYEPLYCVKESKTTEQFIFIIYFI